MSKNKVKVIKLTATRKDGFKVEGNFKSVKVDHEHGLWVSADGREFVCDKVTIEAEKYE